MTPDSALSSCRRAARKPRSIVGASKGCSDNVNARPGMVNLTGRVARANRRILKHRWNVWQVGMRVNPAIWIRSDDWVHE
jgi:hypothetical protein